MICIGRKKTVATVATVAKTPEKDTAFCLLHYYCVKTKKPFYCILTIH